MAHALGKGKTRPLKQRLLTANSASKLGIDLHAMPGFERSKLGDPVAEGARFSNYRHQLAYGRKDGDSCKPKRITARRRA